MNRSTKRCVFFFRILKFISFLHRRMFSACCFRQRTYVVQGHMNSALNETQTHFCLLVECLQVLYE